MCHGTLSASAHIISHYANRGEDFPREHGLPRPRRICRYTISPLFPSLFVFRSSLSSTFCSASFSPVQVERSALNQRIPQPDFLVVTSPASMTRSWYKERGDSRNFTGTTPRFSNRDIWNATRHANAAWKPLLFELVWLCFVLWGCAFDSKETEFCSCLRGSL